MLELLDGEDVSEYTDEYVEELAFKGAGYRKCLVCLTWADKSKFRIEHGHIRDECNTCRSARRRLQRATDEEIAQKQRDQVKRNREKIHPTGLTRAKVYELTKKFNITAEQFIAMWEAQNGLCAICNEPLRTGKGGAGLDHNHQTDKIRDILCNGCNSGIEWFKEDIARLYAAIEYLRRHK